MASQLAEMSLPLRPAAASNSTTDQPHPNPVNTTATAQVFAITELRELILSHVPGCDLLVHRRTCRAFNDFVENHPDINRKLFLDPKDVVTKLQSKRKFRVRANDVVFKRTNSVLLPGVSSRYLKQHSFRIRDFPPELMSLFLSSTDLRPLLLVNLSSAKLNLEAERCLQTPWAKMFLTDPALPTKLRIYTDRDSTYWQYAIVETQPATIGQLLEIAMLVEQYDQDAQVDYVGKGTMVWVARGYWSQVHKWKWNSRARDDLIRRSRNDHKSLSLMKNRPIYFEDEDLNISNALQEAGIAIS